MNRRTQTMAKGISCRSGAAVRFWPVLAEHWRGSPLFCSRWSSHIFPLSSRALDHLKPASSNSFTLRRSVSRGQPTADDRAQAGIAAALGDGD